MIAQHVRHRHLADRRAEQAGALREHRAHQQSAVAAALDGEAIARRVAALDQPLRRGQEVVEDVLLLLQHARLVPGLAVLAAAAEVGQRVHPALFQPVDA